MSASGSLNASATPQSGIPDVPAARSAAEWLPLFALFITAALWLVLGSVFGLIASIKFHSPGFLADCSWLTYGRVRAASSNLLLYGFCLPGGLGAALWIFMRTGKAPMVLPSLALLGTALINLGVLVGFGGILGGDLTGFEGFEMPGYAAVVILLGYMLSGISAVLTLRARQNEGLSVPQWFLLAAVFWFPWIYSSATLLLLIFPVRGVAQSVIAWWFSANLHLVWLGLVGLAAAFHLLPKGPDAEINCRNLALFSFWMLVLFGSWTGVPQTAPAPAWIPALSTSATIVTIVLYIGVLLTARVATRGRCREAWKGPAAFASFGLSAFLLAGLLSVSLTIIGRNDWLTFTWIGPARWHLLVYGFFALTLFGCIFAALNEFSGSATTASRLPRAQFWMAAIGIVLLSLPLIGAGIMQGIKLRRHDGAFVDVTKATLHFLRLSTIGDLILVIANVLLLVFLLSIAFRALRARGRKVIQAAAAEVVR